MDEAGDVLTRGIALRTSGHLKDAVDAFRMVVQRTPSCVEAWCRLADAAEALSDWPTAAQAYEQAVKLAPKFPELLCNYGGVLLKLGRAVDAEAAFRAAIDAKPGFALAHNGLGIALKSRRNFADAASSLREAIRHDPAYAPAYFNLGNTLQALAKFEEAIPAYESALRLGPRTVDVLQNLSVALHDARDFAGAASTAREALRLDLTRAEAFNALGNAELSMGHFDAAARAFQQAIALRPEYVEAITNLGNTWLSMNRLDEALAEYERAQAIRPDLPAGLFNPAMPLLLKGDLRRGFASYEHRLATEERKPRRTYTAPAWTGAEPLEGKTIFVHYEQGIGDTLQFIRYLPLLIQRRAHIILEIQAGLAPLVADDPNVTLLDSSASTIPPHDFHISLLSLPQAFGTDLASIPVNVPYLRTPDAAVERWRVQLAPFARPRVGIACSGNPKHKNDHHRSLPLATLSRLPEVLAAPFHIVQKDLKQPDAATAAAAPLKWINWTGSLTDFAETAALLRNLDLIITVDTSIAHLAGALGCPTWILLPFAPDWRWMLDRRDSPWYPTVRLYRQPKYGDWGSVLSEIASDLRTFAPSG